MTALEFVTAESRGSLNTTGGDEQSKTDMHLGHKVCAKCRLCVLCPCIPGSSSVPQALVMHGFVYMHVYMHLCLHVCTSICVYVCAYVCACTRARVCMCVDVDVDVDVNVYVCICVCIRECVCVCVCVYVDVYASGACG